MLLSLLQPRDQTFRRVEGLFLRLLGLVYVAAFGSLWPQIVGLIGVHGVSPSAPTLAAMQADYGWRAYLYAPSLFWFAPQDGTLEVLCCLGCVAGLLLLLGWLSRVAAVCAYILYLSIVSIGQPFTSFQWDALLLESGFLAIFMGAPWLAVAYRLLLFRLMFAAGVVKLASGDPNWRNLHALRFHFFTEPLPNPLAYYANQLPGAVLDLFVLATFLIELVVPFFVFAFPRRVRQAAAALLVLLQVAIALTGNFAFFNLLSMVLCVWALDDSCLGWFAKLRLPDLPKFPRLANAGVGAIVLLSLLQLFGLELSFIESFEVVNVYGLFAVMTTSRTELVIEGSDDNTNWRSYSFRYKPGDVQRSLPVIAPLQPRLDWQMWFAALGSPLQNDWTKTLVYCLLRGEPQVQGLLAKSPFAKPPRRMRILAYSYTFSTPEERRTSGAIWKRKLLGIWFGPVSMD